MASFSDFLLKAGLTNQEIDSLIIFTQEKQFKKGTIILRENEICPATYFVEKGLLRAYTIDDSAKEHIIQFAPEQWLISNRSSIFFDEPSEFFIDAVEDTIAIEISPNFLEKAVNMNAQFAAFNERLLHNHIRHLQQRLNLLLSATADIRYLNFIKLYPNLLNRIPQWMIASYLGITPESLSRVRKDLSQKS